MTDLGQVGLENCILSFPKCGRTMIRYALLSYKPDNNFTYTHDGFAQSPAIKKEVDYDWTLRLNKYKSSNVILVIRDPRDVMVSLWYNEMYRQKVYKGTLANFIKTTYAMPMMGKAGRMWFQFKRHHQKTIIIAYEDFLSSPHQTLKRILLHCNIKIDNGRVEEAIKASTFSKMKELERSKKFPQKWLQPRDPSRNETYKCREGKIGEYRRYFNNRQIGYINNHIGMDSIYARYYECNFKKQ